MSPRAEDWSMVADVIEHHAQKQSIFVKQTIRDQNYCLTGEEARTFSLAEKRHAVERAVSQYKQIQKRLEQVRQMMRADDGK